MNPAGHPRNLLTSLVLVFPLFLAYQIGVLYTLPMLNGADFLTTLLIRELGLSKLQYLAFTGVVAAAFGLALAWLRRSQRFDAKVILPVLLESCVYALTMGTLIFLVMTKVLGISPRLAVGDVSEQGVLTRLVMSIGAGVYEETVFRLLLLTGLVALLRRALGATRWAAIAVALVLSSFAFAALHHVGAYGEPLRLGVFTFRFLAGIWFAVLYWFRGFAVAVYTHAFYDIYVLLIR